MMKSPETENILNKIDKNIKKKKIITISLLILSFIIGFVALYILVLDKKVYLEGFTSKEKIEVNTNYVDKKFSICYGTIIKCNDVKYNIVGEVDTTKLGEYILKYQYKINNKDEELQRKVLVYDDIKPEIVVDEELAFCSNGKVGRGKYHATDNYDGDITDKVELTIETDKSYLNVSDSSGNTESIEVDALEFTSDPTINLNGEATVYIFLGNSYTDKGATALDICDGDITEKIIKSGEVNTNAVGTYTITYSVENSDGKTASATRKVVVQKRSAYAGGSSCNKAGAIYLTFDDGPQWGTTDKILDILKDEGVKATFFVIGGGPDALIQREHNEGHVVALHSATHDYSKIYKSVDAYFNDLYNVQNRVKRLTGVEAKIIRFPGGSSNTVSRKYQRGIMTTLTNEVLNRGFRYHDWNVNSGDADACSSGSSTCVYNHVVNNLSKSRCNMVLMHDIKWYTRDALRNIIQYGKNNGYTFEVITMDTPLVTHGVNN